MRRPRGYEGIGHETIGSDILAVQHALGALTGTQSATARILGGEATERLAAITPNGWYPIEWLLEMMETLDERVGRFTLLKLGRTLFRMSHQDRLAGAIRCGRDIVYGIDGMYHHANRGQKIGGWRVVSFDANTAVLEKTTPHHCMMEEGILSQALMSVGSPAVITQPECFREGGECCRFVIMPAMHSATWASAPRAS